MPLSALAFNTRAESPRNSRHELAIATVDISLVICSFNRAAMLGPMLEHLACQRIPDGMAWEIVVVDNRSSDDTPKVIEEAAARTGLPIRYVYEGRAGHGIARNAGTANSRGEIVAFTDDDVLPSADWLANILREFRADPELAALGGRVELHDLRDLPVTIRTCTSRYRLRDLEDLMNGPIGCNMAFRRSVLSALGGFDADFGAGAPLPSHEDTELLFRALQTGCKICYVPDVLVFHNHGRRTEEDLDALTKRYVLGRGAMYAKHILRRDGAMLRMAYWELRNETKRAIGGMIALRFRNRSAAVVYYLVAGGLRLVCTRCERALTRLRSG